MVSRTRDRVLHWPREQTIGNVFIASVVILNVTLLVTLFVLIHYMLIDGLTSLLYIGAEPWCTEGQGGIGYHCFGDANLGHMVRMENPWSIDTWNYLAASMVPSWLAIGLGDLLGRPSVGIVLYIIVMAVGMTIPAIWAAHGRALWIRVMLWASLGFLAVPALWAIDRGNVVGFAVPFMMIAVVAIARDKMLLAAIGIALAAAMKPQFGLAIIIFMILGRWIWLLIAGGIAALVQLIPFLLWPADFPGTIFQALRGMFAFGGQNTLSVPIPSSVSWAKGPYLLYEWFIAPFRGGGNSVERHQTLVAVIIVLALIAVLVITRNTTPPSVSLALLFLISALALPTAFTYYYIAVLPLAAIALRDPAEPRPSQDRTTVFRGVFELGERKSWAEFLWAAFLAVTLAASISRVFFPKTMGPEMPFLVYTTADFVTLMWTVAIPGYLITRMVVRRTRERALVTEDPSVV